MLEVRLYDEIAPSARVIGLFIISGLGWDSFFFAETGLVVVACYVPYKRGTYVPFSDSLDQLFDHNIHQDLYLLVLHLLRFVLSDLVPILT